MGLLEMMQSYFRHVSPRCHIERQLADVGTLDHDGSEDNIIFLLRCGAHDAASSSSKGPSSRPPVTKVEPLVKTTGFCVKWAILRYSSCLIFKGNSVCSYVLHHLPIQFNPCSSIPRNTPESSSLCYQDPYRSAPRASSTHAARREHATTHSVVTYTHIYLFTHTQQPWPTPPLLPHTLLSTRPSSLRPTARRSRTTWPTVRYVQAA